MRVAVGVIMANGFPIPPCFFKSWTRMMQFVGGCNDAWYAQTNALLPPDRQVQETNVIHSEAFPVDRARNQIITHFLDRDTSDYLLFLDCDMEHPPDTIWRLLKHNVDVVTGRYPMRKPPFFSVCMRKTGPGPRDYDSIEKLLPLDTITGLVPVDGGGAGVLMVSRRCLTAMRAHLGADNWFMYQDGPDGLRSVSEDMWFYQQAIACGYQPLMDADLWCGHERKEVVTPKDHVPFKDAYLRLQEQAV